MRLCWADKFPLALFALITLIMLFLGSGGAPDTSEYCRYLRLEHPTWTSNESYCFVTAAQHWSAFVSIEALLFWKLVVPVWVVTRLIDLMGGGIAARRADRDEASGLHQADIELRPGEWTTSEPDWRRQRRLRG
jgi:hypothetical protein